MHGSTGGARLRRLARIVGTILLVAGVGAILWGVVIWRFGDPVTALYTRWEQHQLAGRYERLAITVKAATGTKTASGTTVDPVAERKAKRKAARTTHALVETSEPLGRIRVPRLGLNMLFVAGTDHSSLRKGPGWDERTYLPGEGELVYIAGHRTTFGAPFGNIDRLRAGDRVELDLPYGKFVYAVTRSVIVPASDLGRLKSDGHEMVALQACHPRFSARERYIVYAAPVSSRLVAATSAP
jgi:sortase A